MKKTAVILLLIAAAFPLAAQQKALTGFIIKSGDIVDGLIPIYREVVDGLPGGPEILGPAIGSVSRADRRIELEGGWVSAVRMQRGSYFGHSVISWIEIELTKPSVIVKRFGGNQNTQPVGEPVVIETEGHSIFAAGSGQYLNGLQQLTLTGFHIGAGDIIDGITPIYQSIGEDGRMGTEVPGRQFGGTGGGKTKALYPGWKVSSLRYQNCSYFGHRAIGWIEIVWKPVLENTAPPKETFKAGNGSYVNQSYQQESYSVPQGEFFTAVDGRSGSSYAREIKIYR